MFGRFFRSNVQRPRLKSRIRWPELPQDGFLSGRSAGVGDVDKGHAVFSQQAEEGPAKIYPIDIPQYGIWNEQDGSMVPVIVVQAENHITDADGEPILGLRTLEGESVIASADEVELLGTYLPV